VRTITGVPTSITAFVSAELGKDPLDEPVKVNSAADYEAQSSAAVARQHDELRGCAPVFVTNGGSQHVGQSASLPENRSADAAAGRPRIDPWR
jgi:hypothetical protein